MKDKKDGYGFIVTLLLIGWLIGSPAPTDPLPADDTVAVVPSTPDEKGGDPTDDAAQDATAADSGVSASETAASESVSSCQCGNVPEKCACDDCRCSVKCAIARYRANGGTVAYVVGMTDYQHLTRDHKWSAEQLRGLSQTELQYLHGASHAGKMSPSQFVAANRNAAPFTPAAATPRPPGAENVPSPCVLKFTASWCGPCHSTDAVQLKAWLERSGWNVQQIDYDKNAKLVERFDVERIPTWVVIRNGDEVARYTGTSWREMLPVLNKAVQ